VKHAISFHQHSLADGFRTAGRAFAWAAQPQDETNLCIQADGGSAATLLRSLCPQSALMTNARCLTEGGRSRNRRCHVCRPQRAGLTLFRAGVLCADYEGMRLYSRSLVARRKWIQTFAETTAFKQAQTSPALRTGSIVTSSSHYCGFSGKIVEIRHIPRGCETRRFVDAVSTRIGKVRAAN
jgi:hypothetical protein